MIDTTIPQGRPLRSEFRAYLLAGRPVHFPFPSGTLRYECETCDAPCCKGQTLGIGRSRELVTLQKVQPKIALFATPGFAGGAMRSIAAPAEACWFLDRKSRCRLHKAGGPQAKPAGCRLFPFQRIRSMGDAVCVLPDFSCPITSAPLSDDSAFSHDALCLEMHRTGVPRNGHRTLPPPRDMSWRRGVPLERAVVDMCARNLDAGHYLIIADEMRKVTKKFTRNSQRNQLARTYDIVRRTLGVERELSPEGTRELIILTGTLRVMASGLSRAEMPGVLLALSILCAAYEGMRGQKRSLRTPISIFERSLPFLYTLSHLGSRPVIPDVTGARKLIAQLPAVRGPLMDVLASLTKNQTRSVAKTLEDVLREQGDLFCAPMSPDAVTMLHGLGKVLMRTAIFVPV